MKIQINVTCTSCDGYGTCSDRHPIDPSHMLVECSECEGNGQIKYVEEYDSISDAKDDYPCGASFTYL